MKYYIPNKVIWKCPHNKDNIIHSFVKDDKLDFGSGSGRCGVQKDPKRIYCCK